MVKAKKGQGISSGYFFDGKIEDGKALEETFKKAGLKAIYIYSAERNLVEGEVFEVSKKPDSLEEYDVVICSPYIGPGWACVISNFKSVMIHCCGTVSPASVIQSIKRFRAVENVHVAYDLRFAKRNLPVDVLSVAFMMAANEIQNEAFNLSKTISVAENFVKDPVGKAICKMIALENFSRNNYEFFIHKATQALGFDVEIDSPNSRVAGREARKLKKEKDAIAEDKLNFFRNDQFLDKRKLGELRSIKKNKGVDLNNAWLIEKSDAALLMNKRGLFTETELDFILNKNGVELIRKCQVLNMDGNIKNTHANYVKSELFNDLLSFVEAKVFTTESIAAFFEQMKSNKLKWNGMLVSKFTLLTRTIYEFKGVSGGGYIAAKNILKLLGFEMFSSSCKTAGKYEIDCSLFEMANRYIKKSADPEFDQALQLKNKHKLDKLKAMVHEGKSARVPQHEAVQA